MDLEDQLEEALAAGRNSSEPLSDPPEGYVGKGLGAAWLGGDTCNNYTRHLQEPTSLPLGPPGRGQGTKARPEPTREGFEASKARRDPVSGPEAREHDLLKLRAVCDPEFESKLYESEGDAFPDMLDRMEKGSHALSEKQRAWLDKALVRLGIDVPAPEQVELPGEFVPRGRKTDPRNIKPDAPTLCADCGRPQFDTPSGISCAGGHGGATSVKGWPRATAGLFLAELGTSLANAKEEEFAKWQPFQQPFQGIDDETFIPFVQTQDGKIVAFLASEFGDFFLDDLDTKKSLGPIPHVHLIADHVRALRKANPGADWVFHPALNIQEIDVSLKDETAAVKVEADPLTMKPVFTSTLDLFGSLSSGKQHESAIQAPKRRRRSEGGPK